MKKNYCYFIVLFLIFFHLYFLTQLSFTVWPEMLLMPHLMRHGFELYRDMIIPWTPGLMWILAGWFRLFGLSSERLKLLTWALIAAMDVLIFSIAKKKWGSRSGFVALIFFITLQPIFDGNGLWFDMATVPLLLLAFDYQNPIFFGPAFLIKQSAIWVFPLLARQWKKLLAGIFVSIGGSMLWFLIRGSIREYWLWAYDFTFRLLPRMPGHRDLGNWRLWFFSLTPFFTIGWTRWIQRKKLEKKDHLSQYPFLWALFLIPFVLPRFGLFHFQPAIAFLALEVGYLVQRIHLHEANLVTKSACFLLIAYCFFSWSRLMRFQWHRSDRFLEPEVYQFAAKVALETDAKKPVLLVNGPELTYVLSDHLPPKPWLTQFPWFLELPGFQERMVEEFKDQNLTQVIFVPYQSKGEFFPGSYQPKQLLEYLHTLSP